MGLCTSSLKEYKNAVDTLRKDFDILNDKLSVVDALTLENQRLRKEAASLKIRIEHYGLIMSGNPCRLTPSSYEISKKLGTITL